MGGGDIVDLDVRFDLDIDTDNNTIREIHIEIGRKEDLSFYLCYRFKFYDWDIDTEKITLDKCDESVVKMLYEKCENHLKNDMWEGLGWYEN